MILLQLIADMARQGLRSLTCPLAEMRYRLRGWRLKRRVAAHPVTGGAETLVEHYQGKLGEAVKVAEGLSEQVSALLAEGASLDDERIVALTEQREKAHEDVDAYTETLKAETARAEMNQGAVAALATHSQPSGWVAPKPIETHDKTEMPTPFQTFGQQMKAVALAAHQPDAIDPRLNEIRQYQLGLGEDVPSAGGFLIQTDFSDELLKRIHETGLLVGKPRHIGISARANGLKINAVDEASRVDGSRLGGVQAFWGAEAATITKSKPTFRQIDLRLNKLTGLYYATDEELADTEALEETLAAFFAEEFGFKLDDALIRGTGAGEPLGILGHAGTVSVAKESNQGANTIVKENIEAMFSRLWARSMRTAVWLINQDCWPQLFGLEQAVGTGGVPVFLPAGGLSAAPFGTILGREILPIEQCESLGTKGDIILASFESGYVMIDKGGIDAAVSIHVQFLTDESVFRFILRTDGQPVANSPLTPYLGTKTQSSFITLDTRA